MFVMQNILLYILNGNINRIAYHGEIKLVSDVHNRDAYSISWWSVSCFHVTVEMKKH